jgi:hypothetical protein
MVALVDPEKLEAALASMIEEMKPGLDRSGLVGVIARMQTQVNPPMNRWRAAEVNRGTDPNDVANALVALIAGTLVSEATAVYGREISDDHYGFINMMLQAIAEEFGSQLNGEGGVKSSVIAMDDVAGRA